MTLIAKPIIKDQLWVVTDGINKVGNIETENGQYKLKLGNEVQIFDSTKKISKITNITFDRSGKIQTIHTQPYAKWPTDIDPTYNDVLDVTRGLHLYTREDDSKCYYAAGWFNIVTGSQHETVFCPKYIFLQRYKYQGPYKSKSEAVKATLTTLNTNDSN